MDTMEFTTYWKSQTFKFTGNSVEEIANRAQQFLIEKNIARNRKEVEILIENYFKMNPGKISKRIPRIGEAFHAGMALLQASVGQYASEQEIKRRSKICLTAGPNGGPCPHLSGYSECMGCGGMKNVNNFMLRARKMLGLSKIVLDQSLKTKYCGVCGCSLSLLLITNSFPKESDEENKKRPAFCWMRKDSDNYQEPKN